jgi:hypothetical protein
MRSTSSIIFWRIATAARVSLASISTHNAFGTPPKDACRERIARLGYRHDRLPRQGYLAPHNEKLGACWGNVDVAGRFQLAPCVVKDSIALPGLP